MQSEKRDRKSVPGEELPAVCPLLTLLWLEDLPFGCQAYCALLPVWATYTQDRRPTRPCPSSPAPHPPVPSRAGQDSDSPHCLFLSDVEHQDFRP